MKTCVVVVAAAVVGGVEEAWRRGYVWPIMTTFMRLFSVSPDTELNPVG